MRPRLSIVIPSHNRPDLLRTCLQSVRQYAPSGTQVLVVDDASSEATVCRVAEEFQVGVLRFESRQGYCRAANAGMALARGEIVELLNDDTQVTQGWADAALEYFSDPGVGAVAPLVLRHSDLTLIDSTGDGYHWSGIAFKRHCGKKLSTKHLVPGPVASANGASSFYRREAFLEVGALPESFGAYFDDVDLSLRLRRAGFTIWYAPNSRVHHHGSASHGNATGELLTQQSRNEELVWWRNLEGWQLLLGMPGHVAVLAAKAALRLREGKLGPWMRGRFQAWRQLPQVIEHRRTLPLPVLPAMPSIEMSNLVLAREGDRCRRSLA